MRPRVPEADGIAAYDNLRLEALRAKKYELAERLARKIAVTHATTIDGCIIKAKLLQELLRPEAMGPDRPERRILETLADEMQLSTILYMCDPD